MRWLWAIPLLALLMIGQQAAEQECKSKGGTYVGGHVMTCFAPGTVIP